MLQKTQVHTPRCKNARKCLSTWDIIVFFRSIILPQSSVNSMELLWRDRRPSPSYGAILKSRRKHCIILLRSKQIIFSTWKKRGSSGSVYGHMRNRSCGRGILLFSSKRKPRMYFLLACGKLGKHVRFFRVSFVRICCQVSERTNGVDLKGKRKERRVDLIAMIAHNYSSFLIDCRCWLPSFEEELRRAFS